MVLLRWNLRSRRHDFLPRREGFRVDRCNTIYRQPNKRAGGCEAVSLEDRVKANAAFRLPTCSSSMRADLLLIPGSHLHSPASLSRVIRRSIFGLMRRIIATLLWSQLAVQCLADDKRSTAGERILSLDFPNTVVEDVLEYYRRSVGKPVFVALDIRGGITMKHKGPEKEIPEVIRKTLLEKYGIAMRDLPTGEILVEWSRDPKYPPRKNPTGNHEKKPVAPKASFPLDH